MLMTSMTSHLGHKWSTGIHKLDIRTLASIAWFGSRVKSKEIGKLEKAILVGGAPTWRVFLTVRYTKTNGRQGCKKKHLGLSVVSHILYSKTSWWRIPSPKWVEISWLSQGMTGVWKLISSTVERANKTCRVASQQPDLVLRGKGSACQAP